MPYNVRLRWESENFRGITPKTKRPGRDLNPGQKLRRLLGYPLPYRDTRTCAFPLITRVFSLKRLAPRKMGALQGRLQDPGNIGQKAGLRVTRPGWRGRAAAPECSHPSCAHQNMRLHLVPGEFNQVVAILA